jgi:hypothetical protein
MQGPFRRRHDLSGLFNEWIKKKKNFPLARIFELDIFALECAYACRHYTGLPYSV